MDKDTNIINIDQGPGRNPSGSIVAAANESRFTQSTFSEEVTNFIVGLAGTEMAALIAERDLLAPSVRVGRRFEFKKSKGGLAFLADQDDIRAIGSAFTKVSDSRESVNSKTINRGLTLTLDRDDMLEGDQEQAARTLMAILVRNDIARINALLLANDTNTAKVWGASADPDGDLLSELNAILTARGIWGNTVVFGSAAWIQRRKSYIANTAAGTVPLASLSPAEVALALAVDRVHVSKTVLKTSKKGSKSQVFASNVFAYYADPIASKDDASNLKRFCSACRDGSDFGVYVNELDKVVEISVEQYSTPAITDASGIRSLTVSAT
jgi:hypothetical protein